MLSECAHLPTKFNAWYKSTRLIGALGSLTGAYGSQASTRTELSLRTRIVINTLLFSSLTQNIFIVLRLSGYNLDINLLHCGFSALESQIDEEIELACKERWRERWTEIDKHDLIDLVHKVQHKVLNPILFVTCRHPVPAHHIHLDKRDKHPPKNSIRSQKTFPSTYRAFWRTLFSNQACKSVFVRRLLTVMAGGLYTLRLGYGDRKPWCSPAIQRGVGRLSSTGCSQGSFAI